MAIRSVGGAVMVAVIFFGILGYNFHRKGQVSDRYLTEAYSLVSLCDQYAKEQNYIIGICDAAHESAFNHAYDMGSRRRSASMNDDQYFTELFAAMRDQAVADHKQAVAESIVKLADEFAKGTVTLEPK